ncbi:MAG: glycosyltransferase [Muribaculaceae bacterium]|nr:glycosyltransferase [Muribaculaceae bacterium]
MNKILSIIIPSYNMEAYLPQCLDSLLVDTLKDVEVLVVNDGSKDKTLEIAQSYHRRYPDSIKVIDKTNGNYGSCINAALKMATGKYIKVLDADDSFEKDNFNYFISFLKKQDADLIISDYVIVNEKGEVTSKYSFWDQGEGMAIFFKQCVDVLCNSRFQMHAVTYRRDILLRINYKQLEGISYTDQQWMYEPMNEVNTIVFFPKVIYRYLVGREGQTVSEAVSYKNLNQTIQVVLNMLQSFNRISKTTDKHHLYYLLSRLSQKIPSIYRIGLLKTKDKKIEEDVFKFDQDFERLNSTLYDRYGCDKVAFFSIPYISHWRERRRKGKATPLIDVLGKIVRKIYKIPD